MNFRIIIILFSFIITTASCSNAYEDLPSGVGPILLGKQLVEIGLADLTNEDSTTFRLDGKTFRTFVINTSLTTTDFEVFDELDSNIAVISITINKHDQIVALAWADSDGKPSDIPRIKKEYAPFYDQQLSGEISFHGLPEFRNNTIGFTTTNFLNFHKTRMTVSPTPNKHLLFVLWASSLLDYETVLIGEQFTDNDGRYEDNIHAYKNGAGKETRRIIEVLGNAIEKYRLIHKGQPPLEKSVIHLGIKLIEEGVLKEAPVKLTYDEWDNFIVYEHYGARSNRYKLHSYGRNKQDDGGRKDDIVWTDGSFD